MRAARRGDLDAVRLLLAAKADIDASNKVTGENDPDWRCADHHTHVRWSMAPEFRRNTPFNLTDSGALSFHRNVHQAVVYDNIRIYSGN